MDDLSADPAVTGFSTAEPEKPRPMVEGRLEHQTSGLGFAGVAVRLVARSGGARPRTRLVIGSTTTNVDGGFAIYVYPDGAAMRRACLFECDPADGLHCEAVDVDGAVIAEAGPLDNEAIRKTLPLRLVASKPATRAHLRMLSDFLRASRRVRVSDLVADLASPSIDSPVRLFPIPVRAGLLDALGKALGKSTRAQNRDGGLELAANVRFIDPVAVASRKFRFEPAVLRPIPTPENPTGIQSPVFGGLRWAAPDDVSYRDYLRGVFILYGHQQVLGRGGDVAQWTGVLEKELTTRFFQTFTTGDRASGPLNRLLIPIIRKILVAPTGTGFGFAVPSSTLPPQGALPDRVHLDALLKMTKVKVPELENRYRLPLRESDAVVSSSVLLNIFALKRILSDTAQGPVEPDGNIISPAIPGHGRKPILWDTVVGSAPFFLRFEEWLDRQRPFFPENLFSLRTQIQGYLCGEPWLNKPTKDFLDQQASIPSGSTSITGYAPHFGSVDEVRRVAAFLRAVGEADAKLFEFLTAFDRSEFPKALRLLGEADSLLLKAKPVERSGENWMPFETPHVGLPRSMSFVRRRNLPVTNIAQLSRQVPNGPQGLELFFQLPRPGFTPGWDWNTNIRGLAEARGLAARLVKYQRDFLVPMLRGLCLVGLGDFAGALDRFGSISGGYVGHGQPATPAGAVYNPGASTIGAVYREGPLPYTFRVRYTGNALRDPDPFSPVGDASGITTPSELGPTDLHRVEEEFVRLVQGDAMLQWAEVLYRADDPSSLERARELYKGVFFLHGEEPGTSAWARRVLSPGVGFEDVGNPLRRGQLARARLGMTQLDAGLNFYGYSDEAVPALGYDTLVNAAHRWATGAKTAQTDYLAYLGRIEQMDLDMLAAKAQERKARATVAIAAEQVEIAKAGVVVARKLVTDVEKLIAAKQAEISDANSIFSQFSAYFEGMKSSVSSMVDIGKGASEGWTSLSTSGVGEALGLGGQGAGGGAAAGSGSAGLGSAMSGLGVVGGFAAFAVLSTTTLQGMADAAIKRDGDLKVLQTEALPAALAGVRVQERNVTIANLQGEISTTDLAYARDLINYQNERFLNRDFWDALAGVARRSLRRYLDLAGQAAWFAERALAYRLATPIRMIRIGYFEQRMRDLGGVDRLALDLAELEALRLSAARVTVPLTVTYSLSRDLPLAFGQLKSTGACTFSLTDDDLIAAHPGTFAHRVRGVDVLVDAPGTAVPARGILTNGGFSLLRRAPAAPRVPLLRFSDAYPISEFRLRSDMTLHGMPGEHLLPFEGAGFTTTWTLELPKAANATSLNRVTDVRITFDIQAAYEVPSALVPAPSGPASRAVFVSALALDSTGLNTLRKAAVPLGKVRFDLDRLALPVDAVITNLAVVLPGVVGGSFDATLSFGATAATSFQIDDGLAMSNTGVLNDGNPANRQPLNGAVAGSPARPATVTITKGTDAARLAAVRDALLWIEYRVP